MAFQRPYALFHALPLFGDRKPIPVALSPFSEDEPRFSFDGKWLAYNSNESGTTQVYVVSFPSSFVPAQRSNQDPLGRSSIPGWMPIRLAISSRSARMASAS